MLCTLTFLFLVVSSNQKDCYSWRKPTVAEKASLPEKDINRFCRTTTFFGFQTNIKGVFFFLTFSVQYLKGKVISLNIAIFVLCKAIYQE
jgi:hypothetical protein